MKSIESIFNQIRTIKVASQEMHMFINSLALEDYASLATIFILGRDGWDRDFEDTNELVSFIEDQELNGVRVNQKMIDDVFLTSERKQKQLDTIYQYELSNSAEYNWLSSKTNLVLEVEEGLRMLQE